MVIFCKHSSEAFFNGFCITKFLILADGVEKESACLYIEKIYKTKITNTYRLRAYSGKPLIKIFYQDNQNRILVKIIEHSERTCKIISIW